MMWFLGGFLCGGVFFGVVCIWVIVSTDRGMRGGGGEG